MTREEFNNKVMEQFNKYKEEMLVQSPERIFNCAYEIAKMAALKDYFTETDDWDIDRLYPYADDILDEWRSSTLYFANIDEAQWTNWENISSMIFDYLKEKSE